MGGGPKSIAVIGSGTMGAGIAQLAAMHGCDVVLVDLNRELLDRAGGLIRQQLDRAVDKGKLTSERREGILSRIGFRTDIEAVGAVHLAIEAVVENVEVKRKVFRALEKATPATTVLATNTSSLSVSKIAEGVDDPSRVIGMHFFNPAMVMPLVEVIAGEKSSDRSLAVGFDAASAWGKTAVRAKDTPGFIVNRVARGYYLEALRLLGEGVAGVSEIDLVMKSLGGFKMGPFELMDLVGLDVNLAVSTSVWEQMGKSARFAPHRIQQELVAKGQLGRKSGRGFYSYDGDRPAIPACVVDRRSFSLNPLLADAMAAFGARVGAAREGPVLAGSTECYILARILGAVLNEAGHALSDGVASREDIDIAMIKGTNYPKGPLAWAEEIGPRTVRGLLKAMNEAAGDGRYEAARHFADAY